MIKCYTIHGLVRTCLAIPAVGNSSNAFMATYKPCSLYFRSFDDALTYAQRYCSDFPWSIYVDFDKMVARSPCPSRL